MASVLTEVLLHQLAEHVPKVRRHGEVAPLEQLLGPEAGPRPVHRAPAYGPAHDEHHVAVAVVGPPVAVFRVVRPMARESQRSDIRTDSVTILTMKRVSIQVLKARLSATIAEAHAGSTILITRHNEPIAQLGPASSQHLHRGTRVGTGRIRSATKRGTKGRYLAVLMEDRGNR